MAVARTFVVKQAIFTPTGGSPVTWNAAAGGPVNFGYNLSSTPVVSRTADDFYPRRVSLQDGNAIATLSLGEAKITTPARGSTGSLAVTIRYHEGNEDILLTLATMMLHDVRGTQNRATGSDSVLTFIHVSADGQAIPLS